LQKNTKTHEDLFLEVIPKTVCMIFVGKNCRQKLHKKIQASLGKNPSQPQKFACSYSAGV